MENCVIDKTAKVGKKVKIGHFCVVMKGVIIGENSRLGNGVIVYPGVKIGKKTWIEDHAVLGRQPKGAKHLALKIKDRKPLKIGDNVVVGALTVIYADCKLGNNVYIADGCLIREGNKIDDWVRIGKGVTFEHDAHLKKGVIVQANANIAEYMVVGEKAFIGNTFSPNADKYMKVHSERFNPPKIRKNARIGGNVTILPGVIVGENAVVGAGAVVTKNVPKNTIVVGNPAKFLKKVDI